jgi:murein DD-endopeptidase MepM/ murein hydrolase activator NlpD
LAPNKAASTVALRTRARDVPGSYSLQAGAARYSIARNGPHVHVGFDINGISVNPFNYLPPTGN